MKKILVMGMVAMAAMVSQASYLYWQVQQGDISTISYTDDPSVKANYAALWVVKDGQETAIDGYEIALNEKPVMPPVSTDLGVYGSDGYSFFIELSNWNSANDISTRTVLGRGQTETYASLVSKNYVQADHLTSIPFAWSGSPYNVPEPTSGMMLMVGLGLLALRRKIVV